MIDQLAAVRRDLSELTGKKGSSFGPSRRATISVLLSAVAVIRISIPPVLGGDSSTVTPPVVSPASLPMVGTVGSRLVALASLAPVGVLVLGSPLAPDVVSRLNAGFGIVQASTRPTGMSARIPGG